jgi:hypothetical protein
VAIIGTTENPAAALGATNRRLVRLQTTATLDDHGRGVVATSS